MNAFKPTLMIDFDETITKKRGYAFAPDECAVEAINKLKAKYNIIIYSCRANRDIYGVAEYVLLTEYLERYNVYYDEIHERKPAFFAIIDDRSMNPKTEGWDVVTDELLAKIG